MADHQRVPHVCDCDDCLRDPCGQNAKDHQAINRVIASLDERRRRLFAGLLAQQAGHGGITRLARITGLSRTTVLRGLRELQADPDPRPRIRRPGGGRKPVEKKRLAS